MMKNDRSVKKSVSDRENGQAFGLYIHIPFCVRKCQYCDFLSFPADEQAQHQYVEALVQEMELWEEKIDSPAIDTIFIGGGTPSALSADGMNILLKAVHKHFRTNKLKEFTIECNPGTVSVDKLRLYRDMGVNRLSIGMQSTIESELRSLGRIHSYRDFLECYEQARKQGFENINIDVMAAVPGQTLESYEKTLRRVIKLKPEHISSYSLIIEEGTPFYELYADNPPVDEETDRRMYQDTEELLAGAGYERYEISNYARVGKECRHNLKYWKRKEYLGLGLGASSFMSHSRFSNIRDMESYINQIRIGELPVAVTEKLSAEEEKSEFMYLGLRCIDGISEKRFYECFGEELEACYGSEIRRCLEQGLLMREKDRLFLTKRGIDVSNRVFAEFV